MLINQLSPTPNSKRKTKRIGRGIGSGYGKTATKGHKGQWARSGGGVRVGFEGGQIPLTRRLPKHGFTNSWAKEYSCVNVSSLANLKAGTEVTAELLLEMGIISKIQQYGLKILGNGEIKVALTVKAAAFTKQAEEKITKAGGKAIKIVATPKAEVAKAESKVKVKK